LGATADDSVRTVLEKQGRPFIGGFKIAVADA
jgi:hypothetical protein